MWQNLSPLPITIAILLSGCAGTSSNSLETNQGRPVVAKLEGGMSKKVSLDFGQGLICLGEYQGTAFVEDKEFPLNCSDGGKGVGIVKASTRNDVDIADLSFSLQNGDSGNVSIEAGQEVATEKDLQLDRIETCNAAGASEKAMMAFRMRLNGVTLASAREQLGSAAEGSVGYLVREAALAAAFSSNVESSREAGLLGVAQCADGFRRVGN